MELTKSPGYDWAITYRYDDEEVDVVHVFGRMTIEEAILEARRSFADEDQSLVQVFKVERMR